MSIWLDPTGLASYGLGCCDRCSRKMSILQLYPDPNFPGLRVCKDDLDELDPYRLPARQTETITLAFYRPDVPLYTSPSGLVTENDDYFLVSEETGLDGSLNPKDKYLLP